MQGAVEGVLHDIFRGEIGAARYDRKRNQILREDGVRSLLPTTSLIHSEPNAIEAAPTI